MHILYFMGPLHVVGSRFGYTYYLNKPLVGCELTFGAKHGEACIDRSQGSRLKKQEEEEG